MSTDPRQTAIDSYMKGEISEDEMFAELNRIKPGEGDLLRNYFASREVKEPPSPRFALDSDEDGPLIVQTQGEDPEQAFTVLEKYYVVRHAMDRVLFPADEEAALEAIDAFWEQITAGMPTLDRTPAGDDDTEETSR